MVIAFINLKVFDMTKKDPWEIFPLPTYQMWNIQHHPCYHTLTHLPFFKSTKQVHTLETSHRQIQLSRMLFYSIFTQPIPTYPSEFNFKVTPQGTFNNHKSGSDLPYMSYSILVFFRFQSTVYNQTCVCVNIYLISLSPNRVHVPCSMWAKPTGVFFTTILATLNIMPDRVWVFNKYL